jgi:RNA polymerase sigma-70 factor (ECF subfamily)
MSDDTTSFEAVALFDEIAWLERLAASLVGGTERAGDVVQDVLVAAIQRRPHASGPGSLRPWLAAVARKLVLRGARRAARRTSIERRSARDEALPSAAQAVERVELSRLLADAVLALDEPYRSAVIWRHLEQLSAGEIAVRQGTSAEVARQRVSRGLAILRERLDRSFGERSAWCAIFGLRFQLPAASVSSNSVGAGSAAAAGVHGGMAMGGWIMGTKSVGFAVAAGVLAIATWTGLRAVVGGGDTKDRVAAPSAGAEGSSGLAAPQVGSVSNPAGDDSPQRRAVDPAKAVVAGVVRGRRGQPIPGARVHLEVNGVLLAAAPERETDSAGRFQWSPQEASPSGTGLLAIAENPDYFSASAPIEVDHSCELVLAARPVVEGRLLLPGNQPVETPSEVTLVMTVGNSERSVAGETVCGSDGSFVSRGLEEGHLTGVMGRARGFARTWHALDQPLVAEGHVHLDLLLDVGASARGIVLDARTRSPIAGARVFAEVFRYQENGCSPSTLTDSAGRFELAGIHVADVIQANQQKVSTVSVIPIGAEAAGYAHSQEMVVPKTLDQVFEGVEILLEPAGGIVAGRIVNAGMEPRPGVGVYLVDAEHNLLFQKSQSDGGFRFEVLPEGPSTVFAVDKDCPTEDRAWVRRGEDVLIGVVRELELVLAPTTASLDGRIVDPAGLPVPGARIELRWSMGSRDFLWQFGHVDDVTDEDGAFSLEHLFPGQYEIVSVGSESGQEFVLASRPNSAWFDADEHQSLGDLAVAEPVAIHGRIGGRASDTGWEVELFRASDGGSVARTRSAPDGSFALTDLFPADFDLVVLEEGHELARVSVGPSGASDLLVSLP